MRVEFRVDWKRKLKVAEKKNWEVSVCTIDAAHYRFILTYIYFSISNFNI